jgi:hypothetical protein
MRNHIADSQPTCQQLVFLKWRQQSFGETGFEKRGPKAIAWSREVMANCCCVKAGIDSAKEHSQVRGNHVRQGFAGSVD